MPPNIREGHLKNHHQQLKLLVCWMEQLGIPIKNSRISRYETALAEMLQVAEPRMFETEGDTFKQFVNTLYEFHELNQIYKAFSNESPNDLLKDALSHIVSGPVAAALEQGSSSNKSRNTVFELLLAAYLKQGGVNSVISHPSDISCKIGDAVLHFECKRPQSLKTIDKNLKKANSQLKKGNRIAGHPNNFGVIAVDLTKGFASECLSLKYSDMSEINHLTNYAANYLADFIEEQSKVKFHWKVLGVIGRISLVAIPELPDGKIVYWQRYVFNRFITIPPSAKNISDGLATVLERANSV